MKNWVLASGNESIRASAFVSHIKKDISIETCYDWGLFFNSSEARTLEYSKVLKPNSIKEILLVDFKNNNCEFKKNNLLQNQKLLADIAQEKIKILNDIDIFNYEENLELILGMSPLSRIYTSSKCFIDITGVPLIYSSALFRPLLLKLPRTSIHFLNVSAKYEKDHGCSYQFSDGVQENIFIPGYFGRPDFSKPWAYIFILGFEGDRSLSILKRNQPEFVEAIIADPGYQENYFTEAKEINGAFLNEANLLESDIHKVDAGDPIEAYNCIIQLVRKYKKAANICLVPLGTKPHAIGSSLASIYDSDISIMYQVPKKYSINNSQAGDKIWIYKFN